jgi:signal transduction histidine kinase
VAERRVLVVDDNAALVDNLVEILDDAGYATTRAASCAEARAAAPAGFEVALVDVRLPDGSGLLLAEELKGAARDAEIILLTGHASTESAAQAVRAGAFAYLVKPVATPDLLLTIEQAARKVALTNEKRDLERRARRAEKLAAVGTLAAGLSHEIRNPLNAALLQLTVLERRMKRIDGLDPSVFEPLELVQTEIQRLNKVLEEFLQFARPREIERAPVEIEPLLGRVADLLEPQAQAAGVALVRQIAAPVTLSADATRLQQALVNLILNAIQAAPAGGQVRVEAAARADEVEIAVEDSGPGVPAHLRERVFEPFFTTKAAGSGLGLPLVHAIAQQHDGSVALEDSAAGGARFVLRLPRR